MAQGLAALSQIRNGSGIACIARGYWATREVLQEWVLLCLEEAEWKQGHDWLRSQTFL